MNQSHLRNFAIIAHIDHGKSTLADRMLELTGTISDRDQTAQLLDSNPIERERGITIKLAPVRMRYAHRLKSNDVRFTNNSEYILNLIDTPGHVDFSYEVSRSLAACEGVVLVVDATQGVQAQTVAHMRQVRSRNLPVIPVINKIDLPQADVAGVQRQLGEMFGFERDNCIAVSAKTGRGVPRLLQTIVHKIPPPSSTADRPLRALVFSSQYDTHRGVVSFVRIVDGALHASDQTHLRFMASDATFQPLEIGFFTPQMHPTSRLQAGDVGYIATGLKDSSRARVGDTIAATYKAEKNSPPPLPGYQEPKPMVFLEVYPIDSGEYELLRDAVEKLHLSDSALTFAPSASKALGHGFHCGFLGLLHAEVVLERLHREFAVQAISTVPSVEYHVRTTAGQLRTVRKPEDLPDRTTIAQITEPVMLATIFVDQAYVGNVIQLTAANRAELQDMSYIENHVRLTYTIPLSEMIVDFFDRLKSITAGYASLDYEYFSHEPVNAVKLSILINHEPVDALSMLVVVEQAEIVGRRMVERLKDVLPRQNFEIPVQAAVGGKIIARETVKAYRKDVTAKLYGGDRSRKDKLLQKQKKGKKRMKMVGRVQIPQEAFLAVLRN